jgi:hypothetical protein
MECKKETFFDSKSGADCITIAPASGKTTNCHQCNSAISERRRAITTSATMVEKKKAKRKYLQLLFLKTWYTIDLTVYGAYEKDMEYDKIIFQEYRCFSWYAS